MIEQILKVSFLALKKIKSGNFKSVREELDILNIDYTDDDLLAAFGIAQETESIEEAITLLKNSSEDMVKNAKKKIKDHEKKEIIAEKIKKEEEEKNEILNERLKEQARAFNFIGNIDSYKICGAKSMYELEAEVRREMKNGYFPYGGISTYNPGGKLLNPPDSFFQAMVMFK